MKNSELFAKIGTSLWIIFGGTALISLLLHVLGVFDAGNMPWRALGVLFGVGGLAAFVVAGMLAVWQKD